MFNKWTPRSMRHAKLQTAHFWTISIPYFHFQTNGLDISDWRRETKYKCWYYSLTLDIHAIKVLQQGLGIFLFATVSRPALGLTQPPIQSVPEVLSLWVERSEQDANHSPPSSAEVKEWVKLHFHSPNTPSWSGVHFKKITGTILPLPL